MTDVARTPDDRFADLPGYPYAPVYEEAVVDGTEVRLARVDEGPDDAHPVVLLHGEPTWGFLWRDVLPPLLDAGHRVVVPDHVGFGRSDKPQPRDWYSFARLYDAMDQHLHAAVGDGPPVTLVVHDWGGVLGLPWAAANRDHIARIVVTDTGMYRAGSRMSEAWQAFHDHVQTLDAFPVADMIDGACLTELPPEVRAAYEAPFPDPSFHGGPLAMPLLVPTSEDDPGAAEHMQAWEVFEAWESPPVLFVWADTDPIIPPKVGERMSQLIPGTHAYGTVHGSHFLQEDAGDEIGRRIAAFIDDTPA